MATELNGPGHIAGDYKGGSGANLNEQGDSSTPGGSNNGNSGNHDPNTASSFAAGKQIAAVKSDPKVRQKLSDLIKCTPFYQRSFAKRHVDYRNRWFNG